MCIFCQIINHEMPAERVFENEKMIAIKDIKPSAPIHILIIPKKHIESIACLDEGDISLIGDLVWRAKKIAEELGVAEKGYKLIFNTGQEGGQIVPHIHLHLLAGKQF